MRVSAFIGVIGFALALWAALVRGALAPDLGVGRRYRPLGPFELRIAAPREIVFDVVSSPYLGRTPRALRAKLEVLERGEDMVLAAHRTPAYGLVATTVETVRFEPPSAVHFRLVRGPVPHVARAVRAARDGGRNEARVHRRARHRPVGARQPLGRRRRADAGKRRSDESLRSIAAEAERRAQPG